MIICNINIHTNQQIDSRLIRIKDENTIQAERNKIKEGENNKPNYYNYKFVMSSPRLGYQTPMTNHPSRGKFDEFD